MMEKESDNVANKDENISEKEILSENTSVIEDHNNENKESSEEDNVKINPEDLKNTINNNDARLEQLEKEHETLKSQYVRIAADFDNFRKRQSRDQDDLKIQLVSKALTAILLSLIHI